MGNAAWVCFDCREAVRRLMQYDKDVPCPRCGRTCRGIGHRIPVPPKRDARAWAALRASQTAERLNRVELEQRDSVRRRHDLERQLAELESRPPDPHRRLAIRRLKRTLGLPLDPSDP